MKVSFGGKARLLTALGIAFTLYFLYVIFQLAPKSLQDAKEATIRHDLRVMRDLICQFREDHQHYPSSLQELVTAEYLRAVPIDYLTGSSDTWVQIQCDDESAALAKRCRYLQKNFEVRFSGNQLQREVCAAAAPGSCLVAVSSGALGVDSDGIPYSSY